MSEMTEHCQNCLKETNVGCKITFMAVLYHTHKTLASVSFKIGYNCHSVFFYNSVISDVILVSKSYNEKAQN